MHRLGPTSSSDLKTGELQKSITLPATLAIGFTGHRNLEDEAASRSAILQILQNWKSKTQGIVYGVASVAAGGDLLFTETCLELGLAVRILLPLPREQFREDFDEATWKRAERVLESAMSVEVVGGSDTREEAYYDCGIETVQQSQLLVALWDGGPARGMGGTADMVDFAKNQNRPVVWIHSGTAAIQEFNVTDALLDDPEVDYLNSQPEPAEKPPTDTPEDLVRAWFLKMDENATRVAPNFRRLAAIPILCTATAAIFTGVGPFIGHGGIFIGLGIVLGLMAGALPLIMKLNHRQIVWVRFRTVAEICRSLLAFWDTPGPYNLIGPEVMPELSGMLMTLNYLKMSSGSGKRTSVQKFKDSYRKDRVQDQIKYFDYQFVHSEKMGGGYKIADVTAISLALLTSAWILLSPHLTNDPLSRHWEHVISLASVIFFQIATVAGTMLVVNDWQRRRQRFRSLHDLLKAWDKQLELSRTWPILLRIASKVERALLAEVIEWRSLIRNLSVPHK
jgi:hypothetical protein